MDFKIGKYEVYGVEYAIKASGNPMRTAFNREPLDEKDLKRATILGNCHAGEGHDNYLKGCVVEFDITAPLFRWKEAQRYHFLNFVSSQSTMHCLLKFDVGSQCVSDTNPEVIEVCEKIKAEYNAIPEEDAASRGAKWRELVASLPSGFCLGATMVTNYQQLKTIYFQRRFHKLKERHIFCDRVVTLPYFKQLVGIDKEAEKTKE
jgi:hypothetical protein